MSKVERVYPKFAGTLHLLQMWGFGPAKHLKSALLEDSPPHLLGSQESPLQPNGVLIIWCLKWYGFPQRSRGASPPLPAHGCWFWHLLGRREGKLGSRSQEAAWSQGHLPWDTCWCGREAASTHVVLHSDLSLHCVLGVQGTPVPVGGLEESYLGWLPAQHRRGHLGHTPTETFQSCQLKI